ncbi:hypothetical protein CLV70_109165 [Pseudosporangium ferrugineum]|uniref:Uncharacterized protein n=1 Tax=Pseudosporangium ferrugineum TaxID=439699 RepID=A0A2T0S3M6_9ACTN|nr:hypothetical protein CLV70_109165 [Pseudosporangium ferrugineum]
MGSPSEHRQCSSVNPCCVPPDCLSLPPGGFDVPRPCAERGPSMTIIRPPHSPLQMHVHPPVPLVSAVWCDLGQDREEASPAVPGGGLREGRGGRSGLDRIAFGRLSGPRSGHSRGDRAGSSGGGFGGACADFAHSGICAGTRRGAVREAVTQRSGSRLLIDGSGWERAQVGTGRAMSPAGDRPGARRASGRRGTVQDAGSRRGTGPGAGGRCGAGLSAGGRRGAGQGAGGRRARDRLVAVRWIGEVAA